MEKKPIRNKGKLSLSRYFQKFDNGDFVSIVREISLQPRFPKRLQGETGIVEGRRGKVYVVKVKNKRFLIEPIHLKKIKNL